MGKKKKVGWWNGAAKYVEPPEPAVYSFCVGDKVSYTIDEYRGNPGSGTGGRREKHTKSGEGIIESAPKHGLFITVKTSSGFKEGINRDCFDRVRVLN